MGQQVVGVVGVVGEGGGADRGHVSRIRVGLPGTRSEVKVRAQHPHLTPTTLRGQHPHLTPTSLRGTTPTTYYCLSEGPNTHT